MMKVPHIVCARLSFITPTLDPRANHGRNTLAYIINCFRRSRLVQYWAPVLIWMAGISYFSSRPDPLDFLPSSGPGISVDRLAHIGEYAGLAALLHRALSNSRRGDEEKGRARDNVRRSSLPLRVPLSICLLFAFLDELHQELTPDRDFELADVGYDLIGVIAALGLIWLRGRGRGAGEQRPI